MAEERKEILSKEQFEILDVPRKLDYIYDTLIPIAESYNYVVLVKQFGVGLAGIIVTIASIGSAIIWAWNFLMHHFH